jgi:hypothetical protein
MWLAFDLSTETFATLVPDLSHFDPDLGSAADWLFGIAETSCPTAGAARRPRTRLVSNCRALALRLVGSHGAWAAIASAA